ncbi:MAG: OmpA family protein [Bacteroidales bacterium]
MSLKKAIAFSLLVIEILIIHNSVSAQEKYYTKSKKAVKLFEQALTSYNLKYFDQAKSLLDEALKIDNQFLDAYILLGEIASDEEKTDEALKFYSKAISIKPDYNPLMYLRRADLQKNIGKYSGALDDYNQFLALTPKNKDYQEYVDNRINQCKYAIDLMNHPVTFNPKNLGSEINTKISEYWPSITADERLLVYTSSDRKLNTQEDLYFSENEKGKWNKASKFSVVINTSQSEGAQTISADGRTMIFTGCLRNDGFGSCDLYWTEKKGDSWTKPANMGPVINSSSKETQPCLSPDGKKLYFVSNRPGGKGKLDIWMSTRTEQLNWTQPLNLGDSINTIEDELSPFLYYDEKTLYFASSGHPGLGGSDLYMTVKNDSGNWKKPVNLGYPINTFNNEESIFLTSDGSRGLFSSDQPGGYGQKDIYEFEIPGNLRPAKTIFIRGITFDSKSKQKLSARIQISNFYENVTYKTESDAVTGEFLVCLKPGRKYSFNVNKKGYMLYSESYNLADSAITIEIPLQPIEVGQLTILKNILFEYNSFTLKVESTPELDKTVEFIKQNNLTVEIQGHTDNTGTNAYNQKLSENRAKTVYEYLLKSGIDKKKLSFKGFGASQPIASNESEYGKALNRRTVIKIVSKE